jgi:Zn-dependent peptidase ImmA (M78 family)
MPNRYRRSDLHKHIVAVMDEVGEDDPYTAVRIKAREVVAQFVGTFDCSPPFDVNAIASYRGLHLSADDPRFSPDSEIAPEADGRVVLRINKNRPETRQRFSVCHEIGHTLFPEYHIEVQCRKRINQSFADSQDILESLCDAAASEIMFPSPWFNNRIAMINISATSISEVANEFRASRDATVRRLVEVTEVPMAAIFLSWKLKPTQKKALKRKKIIKPLFAEMQSDLPKPMLRVDYAITNEAFNLNNSGHIAKDKSVPDDCLIHSASVNQSLSDGPIDVDFGGLSGHFKASVLPIYTDSDCVGPDDATSVVAILYPMK